MRRTLCILALAVTSSSCSLGGDLSAPVVAADAAPDAVRDVGIDSAGEDAPDLGLEGLDPDAELPSDLECLSSADCFLTELCMDFRCGVADVECGSNAECTSPPECHQSPGRCIDGECEYDPLEVGAACQGDDLCRVGATCDETLTCVGGAPECELPEPECRGGRARVAVGAAGCHPGDGSCEYHFVATECAECDLEACLCDVACEPQNDGCVVGGCFDGGCVYTEVENGSPCTGGWCVNGACVECQENADCAPESECQVGACSPGGSCATVPAPDGSGCSMGEADGRCFDGACLGCRGDEDCFEDEPFCVDSVCQRCRVAEDCGADARACVDGGCAACATAEHCDDGDPCTFDYCATRIGECRNAAYAGCGAE